MRIDATYKVVTPMFCGGADPKNNAELRLASFKGALRFWWRALAWPRLEGRLEEIQRQEDELFGSAKGGQSRVLMRLDPHDRDPKILNASSVLRVRSRSNANVVGMGARYLGYGVITTRGQLERACLQAPFRFTVRIRCRDLDEKQRKSLENALIALGTFGGMGAKSRKGYGSLVLQSLCVEGNKQWKPPADIDGLKNEIRKLYGDLNGGTWPEFTALSNRSRHVLLPSDKSEPLEILNLVGRELVDFRSWGRNSRILDPEKSKKNITDNSELMKADPQRRSKYPWRIAFGLPRSFGKAQIEPWNDSNATRNGKKLDRRASPLFIHIHECGASPVAVLSFLPARFLPEGRADISVGDRKVEQKPEDKLYCPINDFLDRVLNQNKSKEPFGPSIEVKP